MSSNKSEPPLRLEPRRSRQLALALLLVHGAAMGAVMNLTLPAWAMVGLVGGVIVSLYHAFNTHVLGRSATAICSLYWAADGQWTLVTCAGESLEGRLLSGSYVHPRLVLLGFALARGGRRMVVLLPDSLDRQTFRRLLVRLRTGA